MVNKILDSEEAADLKVKIAEKIKTINIFMIIILGIIGIIILLVIFFPQINTPPGVISSFTSIGILLIVGRILILDFRDIIFHIIDFITG